MDIKRSLYEKLTQQQRNKAIAEAKVRGDEGEVKRLVETSSHKSHMIDLSDLGLPTISSDTLKDVLNDIDGKTAGLPQKSGIESNQILAPVITGEL